MSKTPKLKNGDDENISEATTTCNSKYKWMILIGRLKSLTKIEGRIQVYSSDKNQSQLYDGSGLISRLNHLCYTISYGLYHNLYDMVHFSIQLKTKINSINDSQLHSQQWRWSPIKMNLFFFVLPIEHFEVQNWKWLRLVFCHPVKVVGMTDNFPRLLSSCTVRIGKFLFNCKINFAWYDLERLDWKMKITLLKYLNLSDTNAYTLLRKMDTFISTTHSPALAFFYTKYHFLQL